MNLIEKIAERNGYLMAVDGFKKDGEMDVIGLASLISQCMIGDVAPQAYNVDDLIAGGKVKGDSSHRAVAAHTLNGFIKGVAAVAKGYAGAGAYVTLNQTAIDPFKKAEEVQ